MNKILMLLVAVCCSTVAVAQNVPFEKKYFENDVEGFKEAVRNLNEGNELFEFGDRALFRSAIPNYEAAQDFNPNNALLNFRLGVCYLNSVYKIKALEHFERAYRLDPVVDQAIHYYLGCGYHLAAQWDKAIYEYELYNRSLDRQEEMEMLLHIAKLKEECQYGKQYSSKPRRVWVDNLGDKVNSAFPEYSPMISADESLLIFTTRRDNTTGGGRDLDDNLFFEDIVISEKINGEWTTPFNPGAPLNSEDHDATAGMSADGKTLFVFKGKKRGGDIFVSFLEAGTYTKPMDLGKRINSDFHESGACLSPDGNTLYFVSEKPGGLGGKDIYYSKWDNQKDRWGEAVNMGPIINTKYDDDGVFLHPDGVTLYFSSKGHKTMGGFDIFSSKLTEGKWSRPENIGWPINTPDDDIFFVVSASGRHGYYASFRPDGLGEKDLYKITFLGPPKMPLLNNEDNLLASLSEPVREAVIEPEVEVAASLAILKGIVRDKETGDPIEAQIMLTDNQSSEQLSEFKSDAKTGKYLVSLPGGKNYGIAVQADGYLFHSENFVITDTSGYREYALDVDMKKIAVGSSIVLKNIFFDFDRADLRDESTAELNRLIELLKSNSAIEVEISGHTDSKGPENYNQSLSERRAKAVVAYLTSNGIKENRLTFKGYGESAPIATNDTDEGRQLNRRTEFKVTGL